MITHDTIDGTNLHRTENRMPVGRSNRLYRGIVAALLLAIVYLLAQ